MATVVSLEGKRKAPSLDPLLSLCADDREISENADVVSGAVVLGSTPHAVSSAPSARVPRCTATKRDDRVRGAMQSSMYGSTHTARASAGNDA